MILPRRRIASIGIERACSVLGSLLVAGISLGIYAYPLWQASRISDEVVVDEMYLLDPVRVNADVQGSSSLWEMFHNDYWGRPLHTESSHKSWRPLTVLTLRFLNNHGEWGLFRNVPVPPIFLHRMVNVGMHVALSQMMGILASLLFPSSNLWEARILQWTSSLIFACHPAHVEAVANAANRPHLLALLGSLCAVDPSTQILVVMVAWISGLLCCETMVFQLPSVLITTVIIRWKQMHPTRRHRNWASLRDTTILMAPRCIVLIGLTFGYLLGRYAWDSLDIPDGLLDRAETPFGHLRGTDRLWSYAYIVAIHIGKSLGIDPIGFAHEYSYNCVPPLSNDGFDVRKLVPIGLMVTVLLVTYHLLLRRRDPEAIVMWLMILAWMATLFPITGILKVGTFIADRMVLPSTIVISVMGGHLLSTLVRLSSSNKNDNNSPSQRRYDTCRRIVLFSVSAWIVSGVWAPRVVNRTTEWTRHRWLLARTKVTCPTSAKNLLQLSKLHSGNDREIVDLDKALSLVQESEAMDPEFCRVHFQFAHIYLQQQKYNVLEERLAKALLCHTTAGQALNFWNSYWSAMVQSDPTAKERRDRYLDGIRTQQKLELQQEQGQELYSSRHEL